MMRNWKPMVSALIIVTWNLQTIIRKNNRSTRLGSNPERLLHRHAPQPSALAGTYVHIIKRITYNGNKVPCPETRANFKWANGMLPPLVFFPIIVVFLYQLLPTDKTVTKGYSDSFYPQLHPYKIQKNNTSKINQNQRHESVTNHALSSLVPIIWSNFASTESP